MGGKDTEVSEHTKNILLEAAAFNPLVVRRARQKLGLQSESAYRFERGVDLKAVDYSSWQAVNLIQGLCAGKCVLSRSRGSAETKRSSVKLEAGGVSKVLGVKVMAPRIKSILESLGFKARPAGKNALLVEVPSFRPDAKTAIDLIEEISRIYGYENVPRTLPRVSTEITPDKERDLVWRIKNILVGLGVNEVITYSLIDNSLSRSLFENGAPPGLKPGVPCGAESRPASIPGLKAGVLWRRDKDAAAVEIANPLSQEQEILRPTLVPSLIKCVAYNLNQKQPLVNIFEVANVFSAATPGPKEEPALGVAICGTRSLLLEQGLVKEEPGFLHLKGLLEVLFSRLGIKNYGFSPAGRLRISVELNQKKIGAIIKIESDNLGKFDIKNRDVFVLEVRLQEILANADLGKKYSPLPLYPGIARDISIVLKDNISAADILRAVEAVGKPLLKELNIIDYYKGKQIPAGFRSLTLSCLYRSDERTLTEAEIAPTHSLICSLLIDKYAAKIR
jgi:phenylalanyl-tRNA synthetase beta chain